MLETIYNNFTTLKSCTKKIPKEEALKELGKDKNSVYVLNFLLDKQIKTGISTAKFKKNIELEPDTYFDNIIEMLDYLKNNNTGKDINIINVKTFINNLEESYKSFVSQIVTKTFKCGVTAKVASEFIPEITRSWEMRKGHALVNIKKQLYDKNLIVTLKVDGYRYPVIKYSNNKIEIYSSTGYIDNTLVEIIEEFKNPNIPTGVYDCECVAIGDYKNSTERFHATSKILSTKKENKTGLEMKCFDYIKDIDCFLNYEVYNVPCVKRKLRAQNILLNDDNTRKYKFIDYLIPTYINKRDNDLEKKLDSTFEKVIEQGEEGLVIDIANAFYERKKGNTMFKMKPEVTGDFKVIGFAPGKETSKFKDTLGAFIIEYKDNTVNVSGIPDDLRDEVWNNKDFYLNKLIEVAYSYESKDENGKPSLRFPRFKRLRHDKDPNDISYD